MIESTQEVPAPCPPGEHHTTNIRARAIPSFIIALRPTIYEIDRARTIAETRARARSIGYAQPPTTPLEIVTAQEADAYLGKIAGTGHLADQDEIQARSYEVGALQGKLARKWRGLLQESGSANRVDVVLPFHGVDFQEEQFPTGQPGTTIHLLLGDYQVGESTAPVLDTVNRTYGGENDGDSRLTPERLMFRLGFVATEKQIAQDIFGDALNGLFAHGVSFMAPGVLRVGLPQQV